MRKHLTWLHLQLLPSVDLPQQVHRPEVALTNLLEFFIFLHCEETTGLGQELPSGPALSIKLLHHSTDSSQSRRQTMMGFICVLFMET